MKVLAMKWRRLGDTALWSAALQALSEHVTAHGGEVAIAFPKAYAPLFEADPRFGKKFPLGSSVKDQWEWLRQVRRENFDHCLNFHASQRTARLTRWSGAAQTWIHHHQRNHNREPNPIPGAGTVMSAIERDLNVVRAIGWTGNSPSPKLWLPETWKEEAKATWNTPLPLVVLGVSASRESKLWPLSRYVAVAESLKKDCRVVVAYDAKTVFDRDPQCLTYFEKEKMLAHTPTLDKILGLLSLASLYIGSDSGVKHLACALGTKTITLFGPESRGEWHGYDPEKHIALQKPVLCRDQDPHPPEFAWCGEAVCPLSSHACLHLIFPEEVIPHARRLLATPKYA